MSGSFPLGGLLNHVKQQFIWNIDVYGEGKVTLQLFSFYIWVWPFAQPQCWSSYWAFWGHNLT